MTNRLWRLSSEAAYAGADRLLAGCQAVHGECDVDDFATRGVDVTPARTLTQFGGAE